MSNSDIWKVTITPRFVLILTPSSLPASLRYLQPPPPHPPKKTNLPLAYHEPHFSQSLLNLPLLTKSNLVSAFKSTPPLLTNSSPLLFHILSPPSNLPHPTNIHCPSPFISCHRLQVYHSTPFYQSPLPLFSLITPPLIFTALKIYLPPNQSSLVLPHTSTYLHPSPASV